MEELFYHSGILEFWNSGILELKNNSSIPE
jgi:hypothetical protein